MRHNEKTINLKAEKRIKITREYNLTETDIFILYISSCTLRMDRTKTMAHGRITWNQNYIDICTEYFLLFQYF